MEDVAVSDPSVWAVGPHDIEDAFLTLYVHGKPLKSVGDLAHHRTTVQTADLLEVGELRNLHAIQPHFPAKTPRSERRGLPIIFDESDVMGQQVEAQRAQRVQVQLLKVIRRRLDANLELVVVLKTKRVVAIATVGGAPRGLDIGSTPRLGSDRAQEGGGVKCSRPHFQVIGLLERCILV